MTPTDLRRWRRERGLTQAALGALLGLPCQQRACKQVLRWERGEVEIPAMLALALHTLALRPVSELHRVSDELLAPRAAE